MLRNVIKHALASKKKMLKQPKSEPDQLRLAVAHTETRFNSLARRSDVMMQVWHIQWWGQKKCQFYFCALSVSSSNRGEWTAAIVVNLLGFIFLSFFAYLSARQMCSWNALGAGDSCSGWAGLGRSREASSHGHGQAKVTVLKENEKEEAIHSHG